MVVIYKANNLSDAIGTPEFFIEDVGMIQLIGPCVRWVFCTQAICGEDRILVPTVQVVRTISGIPATIEHMRKVCAASEPAQTAATVRVGIH